MNSPMALHRTVMAVFVFAAIASAAPQRDWATNPAILEVKSPPTRIFALGDIHGDYERMLALLTRANIVDPKILDTKITRPQDARWTGGSAVLVVTGDMIDKGPHPVNVLRFLAALRESAKKAGGRVVVTMGNHEAEFLTSPSETKAKDFISDLQENHIDQTGILGCMGDIGEFLCALPFGAKVGDWFFSHGGNTAGRTLAQLSLDLKNAVIAEGFGAKELANPNSLLEARLGEGTIWFHPPQGKTERDVLAANAAALGVSHIAQGHQPSEVTFADGVKRNKGEMFQRWGLLFLLDTGLSRGVDYSQGALLEITLDAKGHTTKTAAICPGGLKTPLWDRAKNQDSAKAAPCEK